MAIDKNDPEFKAAVKDAVETAIEEATEGLKAKNAELLGKLKKAQKDSVVDPADYSALQQEKAELETKLADANKALKKLGGELDTTKKAHETEAQFVQRLLVDNGLTEALTQNGVTHPVRLKAARAMLSSMVAIKADGENRTAVVGEKPLKDFIKEWVAGDEGKVFADASVNTGGGAQGGGSNSGGAGAKMNRTQFESLTPAQKSAFMADVNAGKAHLVDG